MGRGYVIDGFFARLVFGGCLFTRINGVLGLDAGGLFDENG